LFKDKNSLVLNRFIFLMKKLIEKLKLHSFHEFYFQENTDKNIVKHVPNENYIRWECQMYQYLLKNQKCPIAVPITISNNCFIYQTNKLKSLTEILKNKKSKNFILNELFAFVFNLKNYNFVHGNLHIYNIFYDDLNNQFYLLNLSDSNFIRKENLEIPYYNQQVFSRLVEKNEIKYWDLLSVFSSLKIFFKNDTSTINYIIERISVYIPNETLINYIQEEDFMINAQRLFKKSFKTI
jgi:hypothetical protein